MKHENFKDMISFYIDDVLNENEKQEFETHLEKCSKCKMELDEMKLILSELSLMEELDLPVNFESDLKVKLMENNDIKEKVKFNRKYIYSTVAALILLISGAAYFNSPNFVDDASRNSLPNQKSMSESSVSQDASVTSGGALDTTMQDKVNSSEFLYISEIKVENDNGKYQSWADDVIKKAGGNLLSSSENPASKVYEYEISFDKFWIVFVRITKIDEIKANTNASLSTFIRTEETSDKVVKFDAITKTKIIITVIK